MSNVVDFQAYRQRKQQEMLWQARYAALRGELTQEARAIYAALCRIIEQEAKP